MQGDKGTVSCRWVASKKCFKSLDNRVRKRWINIENLSSGKASQNKGSWAVPWKERSRKSVSYGYRKENVAWELNIRAGMHKTGDWVSCTL